MRMRGIQCYILAPIKGHEFRRACNRIGGQYIKIAPGSPHCINVMEIRHTVSPEMELIDGDSGEEDSMLARKIQQLMIFFSLLIPDMTNEEEQMLDEALIKTYADFGITHDNDSLYLDAKASPPKMKKMPILGDLHKNLLENPMTKRVAIIVSRFVTGSAQSFNQQTNVDLSNKYGWYMQVSFSPLHPLMVICLARAIPTPATVAQYLDTNDMNLHSILGCHTINNDTGSYAYRATQWLDTELNRERFMEILSRCMGEAERAYKKILKKQL